MSGLERALAEALHDAMCDISHHDRETRCSKWAKYPQIAAFVAPRLRKQGVVIFENREALTREVAEAIVVVFRDLGTRADPTALGDGWPSYTEGRDETTVLLVNEAAAALVARLLPGGGE